MKAATALAITAHTVFGLQQALDQPRRAVKTANRDNRFVQAAAILPVVTGKVVPALVGLVVVAQTEDFSQI